MTYDKDIHYHPPKLRPYEPLPTHRALIRSLSGQGLDVPIMAAVLAETFNVKLRYDAILKLFADDIAIGKADLGQQISAALLDVAIKKRNPKALMFLANTHLDWVARQKIEATGTQTVQVVTGFNVPPPEEDESDGFPED